MKPTILITGRDGQLGFELRRTLSPLASIVSIDVDDLDLRDVKAVREFVRAAKPDLVVNAAAYTAVDRAETDREIAHTINGIIPGVLAEEVHRSGAKGIIHYSTDYVFDGTGKHPYCEQDPTSPINVYGETKLAGEMAVGGAGAPYVILRTQWLYGVRGANFMLTILRLAREGKPLRIISDQEGAPTWSRTLAEVTSAVVSRLFDRDDPSRYSGVYHCASSGHTSWHGFARAILEQTAAVFQKRGTEHDWCIRALQTLTPIPGSEYKTPARRPNYSVLSLEKLRQTFGIWMPPWEEQLKLVLEDYR